MKKYQKTQLIEVIMTYANGDRLVQNEGQPDDRWVIHRELFESSYKEVTQ
jgi:hypothetical protein